MPTQRNEIHEKIEKVLSGVGIKRGAWARSAFLQKRAEGDEGEGFQWILSTERPTTVFDWERWEFVQEVLLADGMMVPPNNQVPLLDTHSRHSVKNVLGHVRDFAEAESGQYQARSGKVFFAEDADSVDAKNKVAGNHITDGSVGYTPLKTIWIDEGVEVEIKGRTFTGPLRVTYEWALSEFSLCPIGADVLAKVRLLCL